MTALLARYLTARTVSVTGSGMTTVALPLAAYLLSGSAAVVGLTIAFTYVPYVVVGPIAGVVADRISRRRLMVLSELINAVVVGSIPFAVLFDALTVAHLVTVAAISSASGVLFDAANLAAVPSLFPGDRLTPAMSMMWTATTVADIVGPLAAGGLLLLVDPAMVLAFDAATFLLSGLMLVSLRGSFEEERERQPRLSARAVLTDIRTALGFILDTPALRGTTLASAGMSISGGTVFGLLAVYSIDGLGGSTRGQEVGLLAAAASFGGVVVTVALPRLSATVAEGTLLLVGLWTNLAAGIALGLSSSIGLSLPIMVTYGASFTLVTVTSILMRQRLTPDHLRGRVIVFGRIVALSLARAVGVLGAGALVSLLSIRLTFVVMMTGTALALVAAWTAGLQRLDFRTAKADR